MVIISGAPIFRVFTVFTAYVEASLSPDFRKCRLTCCAISCFTVSLLSLLFTVCVGWDGGIVYLLMVTWALANPMEHSP